MLGSKCLYHLTSPIQFLNSGAGGLKCFMYRILQKQLLRRNDVMSITDIFFQFPLSATAPMVWLPYSSIDQLLQALGENSANSHNIVVSKPLSCLHQSSNGRQILRHDYRFSRRGDKSHLLPIMYCTSLPF